MKISQTYSAKQMTPRPTVPPTAKVAHCDPARLGVQGSAVKHTAMSTTLPIRA